MKKIKDEELIDWFRDNYICNHEIPEELRSNIEELVVRFCITQDVLADQREMMEEMKSKHYKDAELARVGKENRRLREETRNSFGISDVQKKEIEDWVEKHAKECPDKEGKFLTYQLTPIGPHVCCFVKVICSCGARHQIAHIK